MVSPFREIMQRFLIESLAIFEIKTGMGNILCLVYKLES